MKKVLLTTILTAGVLAVVNPGEAHAQACSGSNCYPTTVTQTGGYAGYTVLPEAFNVNAYHSVNAEFANQVMGLVNHLMYNILGDDHRPGLIRLRKAAMLLSVKARVIGDAPPQTFNAAMNLVSAIDSNSQLFDSMINSYNESYQNTALCFLTIRERILDLYRVSVPTKR